MVLKKSLFFSFFFIFTAVFSQEESKEILLTDFLLQTEKSYDVKFSFSVEEVSKKHIILPKDTTSIEDVINMAQPVLSHRMALNFSARARGDTLSDLIDETVASFGHRETTA